MSHEMPGQRVVLKPDRCPKYAEPQSGEAQVARLEITKGLKVLDLGCGDGTTAIPEARLGADVLGVDIARNLVEAGNRRASLAKRLKEPKVT